MLPCSSGDKGVVEASKMTKNGNQRSGLDRDITLILEPLEALTFYFPWNFYISVSGLFEPRISNCACCLIHPYGSGFLPPSRANPPWKTKLQGEKPKRPKKALHTYRKSRSITTKNPPGGTTSTNKIMVPLLVSSFNFKPLQPFSFLFRSWDPSETEATCSRSRSGFQKKKPSLSITAPRMLRQCFMNSAGSPAIIRICSFHADEYSSILYQWSLQKGCCIEGHSAI